MNAATPHEAVEGMAVEQLVLDWLAESVRSEGGIEAAVGPVLERVIDHGFAADLLRAKGRRWLRQMWDGSQQKGRLRAEALNPHAIGQRVHKTNALAGDDAIYDALYLVDGEWMRLGDLDLEGVTAVGHAHREKAAANYRIFQIFERIGKRLEGGQTVRDVYSAAELAVIFEEG